MGRLYRVIEKLPMVVMRAAPKPSLARDSYQVKTVSSDTRMSAWPSPVISTKRRLGFRVSILGRDLDRVNGSQPPSAVRSLKPAIGPSN